MTSLPLRLLPLSLCIAVLIGLGGCVHQIPIMQGNFLEAKDVDRVTPGMTRVQVRALLGTPMVADPFHQSRWDYYYYFKSKQLDEPIRQHFVVHFDEQDRVVRVERLKENSKSDGASDESVEQEPEQTAAVR
jgi:outer membrane protein assembly factor BamE